MTHAPKSEKLYTLRGRIGGIHRQFTKGVLETVRFELHCQNGNKSLGIVSAGHKAAEHIMKAHDDRAEIRLKGHYRDFREKNKRGFSEHVQRLDTIFVERVSA